MRLPGRGAIVAGGDDVAVAHDDGAYGGPCAGGALGHHAGDAHEVGIPVESLGHDEFRVY